MLQNLESEKKLQFSDVRRTTVNKVSEFFFITSLSLLNFFKTFPTLDYFYHVLKKSGYRLGTRDCSSNHNLHIIYYSRPASTSLHPPHGCVQTFVCHRYTKWTMRPAIGSPIIQTQNHLVSNKKYETASTKVHFVILIHSGWAFLENATRNSFLIMCLLLLISLFVVHKNSLSPHLLSRFDQHPKLVFLVFCRDPITHDWSSKATLRAECQTLLRDISASLLNTRD